MKNTAKHLWCDLGKRHTEQLLNIPLPSGHGPKPLVKEIGLPLKSCLVSATWPTG